MAIRTLAEFEAAVKALSPISDTHIKLYRGQRHEWDLLPNLFRHYRHDVGQIHPKEDESLAHLKKRIPWNTPLIPKNDWDWLSFGQHYGLKTRMLDWSERHLIGLFFAVEKDADPKLKPVVYVYYATNKQCTDANAKKMDFRKITLTHIMKPAVHSVRVELQKGWHTVHHLHLKKAGGKMVIPLADMKWHQGRMRTIRIDPASAKSLRQELASKGIHRATVYGEFEKVCSSICSECFR